MGTFFSDLFAKIASGIDKLLDSAGQLISSLGGQLVSVFGSILDTVTGIGIYPITSTVGLILNFIIDSIAGLLTILCNSGLQMFNNVDLEYGTGSSIYEIIFINGMSSIFDVLPIFAYGLLGLFFMAHIPDLKDEEEQLIDGAIIKTYNKFGITADNESIYDHNGDIKPMPIIYRAFPFRRRHTEGCLQPSWKDHVRRRYLSERQEPSGYSVPRTG